MITLTVREIADLAMFAGLLRKTECVVDDDELETEISITTEPGLCTDDDGKSERYAHVAHFTELPDEGCMPLGVPIEA